MTISLVIADDHELFRKGLRQLCEVNGGFVVLAEAGTGVEALQAVRQHRPDVALLDIRMPDMTGTEAARQILAELPQTRIIMLTMYHQEHYVIEAVQAGACGYLLKNSDETTLFNAIHAAHAGQGWLDQRVTPQVLDKLRALEPTPSELDAQDINILRLVAQGKDNEAIARQLHLSKGTVANRLRTIFQKINVQNRTEAALYALQHGLAMLNDE